MSIVLSLMPNFFNFGQVLFYYYYIALFSAFFVFAAIEYKAIYQHLKKLGRKYFLLLLAVLAVFLAFDLLFVPATQQLFNDEYIYQSIAKTILYDHIVGICSFSTATHCVPNTAGLFHQPGGWPFLLAITFAIFGINFGAAFNLTLFISAISIILVAYVAFFMFGDKRVAVLSGFTMAFTPLFITFSRATLSDMPAMAFGLLSILFLLLYLRERSLRFGVLSALAIAITLSMKVDAVIILPILLVILLLNRETFKKRWKRVELYKLAATISLLFVILIPELLFLDFAPSQGFGNPSGTPMFSLNYLKENITTNTLFWFGSYTSTQFGYNGTNYIYHVEYPLSFTAFALVGLAFILFRKQFRAAFQMILWFAFVLFFYTSYYGGSVLYSVGDDVRYFLIAFPVIAILASVGTVSLHDFAKDHMPGNLPHSPKRKPKHSMHIILRNVLLASLLLMLLFSNAVIQIVNIVTLPPSHLLPFAAERYDEHFILASESLIPKNCMVVTFKPPLWYILGYPNIYTSWTSLPQFESEFNKISNNCVYFDKSTSCYLTNANQGGPNTEQQCDNFMQSHLLLPVNTTNFDNFTWNVTFGIYKVLPLNSSS
ncbi:MAG: ArnT family glycosyltransferase [Candidatus Micrarchaeia archaeon]